MLFYISHGLYVVLQLYYPIASIIVYAVLLVLTIPGQINPNNKANQSIDQSFLGKTMYQNNILNVFFKMRTNAV